MKNKIILGIVVIIGLVLVVPIVGSTVQQRTLPEYAVKAVETCLTALIAIVSFYIGDKYGEDKNRD